MGSLASENDWEEDDDDASSLGSFASDSLLSLGASSVLTPHGNASVAQQLGAVAELPADGDLDNDDLSVDSSDNASPPQSSQLKQHYIEKARSALVEKNYRLALLLIKKVPMDEQVVIAITVEAAYNAWLATPHDMHNEKFGKTTEQQEALAVVQGAFTALLAEKRAMHLVTAFDYVRLTHVYLAEGALLGALQILQLASARGHLENTLVVLQSLTILLRLDQDKQRRSIDNHIGFLLTDVTLEGRDNVQRVELCGGFPSTEWSLSTPSPGVSQRIAEPRSVDLVMVQNSSLPLAFAYLRCACLIKRRAAAAAAAMNKDEQRSQMDLCINTVAEAYHLYTGRRPGRDMGFKELLAWFNDGHLFYEMAHYLETKTPFVLLAEDFYWEAFTRLPLCPEPIERLVHVMRSTKRGRRELVKEMLSRAYQVTRWNMFVRQSLADIEKHEALVGGKGYECVLQPRFQDENDIAEVIQGVMRSYHMRHFLWPSIFARAKAKRDAWKEKVAVANRAWIIACQSSLRKLIRTWRDNAHDLHLLRKKSATLIQKNIRRKVSLLRYAKRVARTIRANGLFFTVAHLNYDLQRVRAFRVWEHCMRYSKFNNAATVLKRTFLANSQGAKLNEAVTRIISVIKVLRRGAQRRLWPHWRERYLNRLKKHARVSIRFFFRAQMIRKREAFAEALMLSKIERVEAMMSVSTTWILPLKRKTMEIWKEERRLRRVASCREYVARALPRVVARLKAKRVVQQRRVVLEIHTSFEKQSLYQRVGRYLKTWHVNSVARHIQRAWRTKLALWAFARQKNIVAGCLVMRLRREERSKTRSLFLWNKFCFLRRRVRHRMARRITIFFKKIVRNRRVIRSTRRKPKAYKLLLTFHMIMLTRAFRKMAAGVVGLHTLMVLGPLFLSRWRQCVRLGFSMWRRKHINQQRMLGMIRILVAHRLDKKFWPGAGSQSVGVFPHLSLSSEEFRFRQMHVRANLVMTWETLRPQEDVKYKNARFFTQARALRAWMAVFRYRHRLKMSYDHSAGARGRAEVCISSAVRYMFMRARAIIVLQSSWRVFKARVNVRLRRIYCLRVGEVEFCLQNKSRWKVLSSLLRQANSRRSSRLTLQCWYRQWKARKCVAERRAYLAWLLGCERRLNLSSKSARALLTKHLRRFVILFAFSVAGLHHRGSSDKDEGDEEGRAAHDAVATSVSLEAEEDSPSYSPPSGVPGLHGPSAAGTKAGPLALATSSLSLRRLVARALAGGGGSGAKGRHGRITSGAPSLDLPSTHRSLAHTQSVLSSHSGFNKSQSLGSLAPSYSGSPGSRLLQEQQRAQQALNFGAAKRLASQVTPQSEEFHVHAYRLRQSGVFVFEGSPDHVGLSVMETEYLLNGASNLFLQNSTSGALQQALLHFRGDKFALCGGTLSAHDVISVLHFSSKRVTPLALHFCEAPCGFSGVLVFLLALGSERLDQGQTQQQGQGQGQGQKREAAAVVLELLDSLCLAASAAHLGFLPGLSQQGASSSDDLSRASDGSSGLGSNASRSSRASGLKGAKAGAAARLGGRSRVVPPLPGHGHGRQTRTLEPLSLSPSLALYSDDDYFNTGGTTASGPGAMGMLGSTPAPRLSSLSCLRELAVDSVSFGPLGVAALLACLGHNTTLETLTVTLSQQALLPSLGKCLRALGANSGLRELRIFGAPLGKHAVQGLHDAVYSGLGGLRMLEFSCAPKDAAAVALGERIVEMAKNRLYRGRLSLSVSVN